MRLTVIAVLAAAVTSGCTGMNLSGLRPLPMADSPRKTPFESAYETGKAHLVAGRTGLAIVMFERALAINPGSTAALNANGAAYDELKRPEIAQRYYEKALALAPNDPDTLNNIAVSLKLAGRVLEARAWFERAVRLDRGNPVIEANLASLARPPAAPELAQLDEPDRSRPHLERLGPALFRLSLPATDLPHNNRPSPPEE